LIKAGESETIINNNNIATSSKIFITFRGDYGSRWWINDQGAGFVDIKVAEPLASDVKFDWWIVGVNEPISTTTITSTPDISSSTPETSTTTLP